MGFEKCGRYPKIDPELMADKLDEWSLRDDATALCQFCALNNTHHQRFMEWEKESIHFAETFKKAKQRIAARMNDKVHKGQYNAGVYHRYIGAYDPFAKAHDDLEKNEELERKKSLETHKANLAKEVTLQVSSEITDQVKRYTDQLNETQARLLKERNKARITNNPDNQS